MATSTRESYVPIVGELPWTMVYCRTSHEPRHIGKETEEAGATTDQEDAVGDWAVPRPLFTDRLPEAPTLPPIAKVLSHHLLLRALAVLGDSCCFSTTVPTLHCIYSQPTEHCCGRC